MASFSSSRLLVPTLCLLTALGIFGTSLYLPSLPAIGKVLGASQESVQFTLALFFLGSAVGNLLLGPLADRLGRLFVARGGIIFFIIASFWCAEAQTILELQAARFLQGMAASAGPLVSRAVGRDLYEGSHLTRFSATIMMIVFLTPAIAPTMGGLIETYFGWEKNFYLLMGLGIFSVVMVWQWLPETHSKHKRTANLAAIWKNYILLFKGSSYGLYCLVMGFQMGAIFCYITASPYFFISLFKWLPEEYGLVGITSAFGNITGFIIARHFAHRLHFHDGIFLGGLLCFLISLIFIGICWFFPIHAYLLILYSVCFYGASALAVVNSSAAAMNLYPSMAGIASAMIGAIQIGSGFFGSVLATTLPTSALILGIAMGSLSFFTLIRGYFLKTRF